MQADIDLRGLGERYEHERPAYEALAKDVAERLKEAARGSGLNCTCYGRAKDVSRLLKKALLKGYSSPYEQILDKAGARILVASPEELPKAEEVIRANFTVEKYEDKSNQIPADQLGYQGIHFDVRLPNELIETISGKAWNLADLSCEIQLQTRAQNLWNDVSHSLLYKPSREAPEAIQRRIYRLVALMQIFDDEVAATRQAISNLPGSESAAMIDHLESHYLRLARKGFNKDSLV